MFQWDAVDTGPDLGGGSQNVLKTFEMAIRHNSRTTRSKLERVFCRWVYFYLRSQICFWPSYGGGRGDRPHRPRPLWIFHWPRTDVPVFSAASTRALHHRAD